MKINNYFSASYHDQFNKILLTAIYFVSTKEPIPIYGYMPAFLP